MGRVSGSRVGVRFVAAKWRSPKERQSGKEESRMLNGYEPRLNGLSHHLDGAQVLPLAPVTEPTDSELLQIYFTLPPEKRKERFADTARAADLFGLSQRTVQHWIKLGVIRALPIGRKYKVDLHSLRAHLKRRVEEQDGQGGGRDEC